MNTPGATSVMYADSKMVQTCMGFDFCIKISYENPGHNNCRVTAVYVDQTSSSHGLQDSRIWRKPWTKSRYPRLRYGETCISSVKHLTG